MAGLTQNQIEKLADAIIEFKRQKQIEEMGKPKLKLNPLKHKRETPNSCYLENNKLRATPFWFNYKNLDLIHKRTLNNKKKLLLHLINLFGIGKINEDTFFDYIQHYIETKGK